MLCLLLVERKKKWGKNEKRNSRRWGGMFPRAGHALLAVCMAWDFHGCYVQLKAGLRVSL
jgi:hypothetical protein